MNLKYFNKKSRPIIIKFCNRWQDSGVSFINKMNISNSFDPYEGQPGYKVQSYLLFDEF